MHALALQMRDGSEQTQPEKSAKELDPETHGVQAAPAVPLELIGVPWKVPAAHGMQRMSLVAVAARA